jgi:nucleotide-binding universal stress UspA family protein
MNAERRGIREKLHCTTLHALMTINCQPVFDAMKYRAVGEDDEVAEVLIEVCRGLDANLLVMGSYGHSRVHELLPGSTTDRILRRSPLPLVLAH